MTPAPTVADVVDLVHARYAPAHAEPWDAVGLAVGDPGAAVHRILLAVDPAEAVVDQALASGADLLITHHPLLLHAVSSVAAVTPGGRAVHRLVSNGCALLTAHTNADVAPDGVSDALAEVLGVGDCVPLVPSTVPGTGIGRVGVLSGVLTLGEFAARVAEALPATAHGVRVAGDLAAPVSRVAVWGGSGADALEAAAASGADVLVTSDLKHHAALDARAAGGPALVDVAHFASEWPWLPRAAALLRADLADRGWQVEVEVSTVVTDPWTARL